MKRKEGKAILQSIGITNPFSLKTVGFCRDTRQVLTIKDWEPNPQANAIKAAFRPHQVIVEFDGLCAFVS